MGLRISEIAGMVLRKTPVMAIRRALATAEEAGIHLTAQQVEAHYLAGGKIDLAVGALIRAKELEVEADWKEVCAINLAGRAPLAMVEKSAEWRIFEFDTIAQDSEQSIQGNCRDGSPVRARVHVQCRLPLMQVTFGSLEHFPLQEALALRTLRAIAEASSVAELDTSRQQHEAGLREFALERLPGLGIQTFRVEFHRA